MTFRLFVISVALAASVHSPGYAQEQDTTATQQADTVQVPVDTLAPLVVTVSKLPLPANRVGFSFSLIDAQELARERPQYLVDALRRLPSAYVDEAAGPGGPTIIRLRGGEEVFTQILIDGVKVNQNGGFFDFQGLSLSNLERIEVARGPQSALYGSSAVSGVVHFISRRGQSGPPRFRLLGDAGQATEHGGSFRATGNFSGGSDRLTYAGGVGTAFSRGIYDVPNDLWTWDGSLRLDAAPSSRWALQGIFRHISVDSDLPVRDPGATRVPLDPNARDERDRTIASIKTSFAASDRWAHTLRTSLYRENFLFEDQRDDVADLGPFDFFVFDADFVLDSDLRRSTVEYYASYEFLPGGPAPILQLSYGGEWVNEKLTDRTSGEFGDGEQTLDRNSVAGFAEIQATPLHRLSLLLGTRIEKYEGLAAEITPRGSARFQLVPSLLSARFAAGRAYKAPNLQQQFLDNPFIASNPDLEPEKSTSWEVGVDVEFPEPRLAIGIGYFRQDFDNLIRTVAQENSTQQINRNLGSSRAHGVEWIVQYRPADRWLLGSDGAWVETEVLDNTGLSESEFPVGEPLPFRPSLVGNAYVEISVLNRVVALIRGSFVGKQTVLTERFSGRRDDLDPYFLTGLRLEYMLSNQARLYTRIDNLFNTAYETAFDRTGIPLTAALGFELTNH